MAYKSKVEFDPGPSGLSREIIGPSTNRMAILFFAPSAGHVTLSNDVIAADGDGIALAAGQAPLYLDFEEHGDVVQRGWYALYSGGASGCSWIQTLV